MHKFLSRFNPFVNQNISYIVKNGSILAFGRGVGIFLALALTYVLANYLPVAMYGNYKYVLTILGILNLVTLPGINTAIVRAVSMGAERAVMTGIKTRVLWGFFATIPTIGIAVYYHLHNNVGLWNAFLLCALFIPILYSFTPYASFLNGKNYFKKLALYNITNSATLSVSLIIAILFIEDISFLTLIGIYLTAMTLPRIILFLLNYKNINKEKDDKTIINYGKHLSAIKGASVVAGSLGSILLFSLAGAPELALFFIAIAPIEHIRSFLQILETLFIPKIASKQWNIVSFGKLFRLTFPLIISTVCITFAYVFTAPFLFTALFPKYIDAIFYSQLYAFSIPFTMLNIVLLSVLKAKQLKKIQYISGGFDIATNMCIVIPATYFFGTMGILVGIIVSKILLFALLSVLLFTNVLKQQP
jgi:O-antigen/teichoic acid export membrane protein